MWFQTTTRFDFFFCTGYQTAFASVHRDITGQENQEKVSKKGWLGKSGKVRENYCKVNENSYFDINILKTVWVSRLSLL